MLAIAVEIRIACEGCHGAVPVNAFTATVICPTCQRPNLLEHGWAWLLADVVKDLEDLIEEEECTARVGPQAKVTYMRLPARCEGCKTPVPDEAANMAQRGWVPCVGCGQWLCFREAPSLMTGIAPGAVALVGEDPDQLGSQPPTGSKRWFICFDAAARARVQPSAIFEWYRFADALVTPHGNIVCAGDYEPEDQCAVWAMNTRLETLWWERGLRFTSSEARLAMSPGGATYLWEPGVHELVVLAPGDGSKVSELGGPEPEGAAVHQLDLTHCVSLTVDVDGSILALIHNRLLRFDQDGAGVPTWHGRVAEAQHAIYGEGRELVPVEPVLLEEAGDCPTVLDEYTRIHVGWDAHLYVERSELLARYDREGRQLYLVQLPLSTVDGRIGADANGYAYVLGNQDGRRRLLRVTPDGHPEVMAMDRRDGGVLGEEDTIAVGHDGVVWMLSFNRRARVLSPDGRVALLSDASRRADRDEDKRRRTVAIPGQPAP
jgi:hypothetical protein